MLKLNCVCNCRVFFVNGRTGMIQCSQCGKRFVWNIDRWQEFKMPTGQVILEVWDEVSTITKKQFEWITDRVRHLPHIKIPKKEVMPIDKPDFVPKRTQNQDIEQRIRQRWRIVILELQANKEFIFSKYSHFGVLRGRDAAKICHRDLKRIGINTKISVKNASAILEAV